MGGYAFRLSEQLTEDERYDPGKCAASYAQKKLRPRIHLTPSRTKPQMKVSSRKWADMACWASRCPNNTAVWHGANYVSYGLVAAKIERWTAATGRLMSYAIQPRECTRSMRMARKKKQRMKLPAQTVPSGEIHFRLLWSDRTRCGLSDPAALKTRAVKNGNGLQADRFPKCWISTAPIADVISLFGPSLEEQAQASAALFLIKAWLRVESAPNRQQAVAARSRHRRDRDGQTSKSRRLRCCPCRRPERPDSAVSPRPPYGISWGALGAAEFCWHASAPSTVWTRKQFNKTAGADTAVPKRKLADMQTESRLGLQARCRWVA